MSPSAPSKTVSLALYCLFNYLGIGAFWVSSSWALISVTHSAGSISYLMLMVSACSIILSPFLGLIVDRTEPRQITITGHAISALACLTPLLLSLENYPIPKEALYLIFFIVNLCTTLILTSTDRAQKLLISEHSLKKTRVQNALFQQMGLMLGTSLAGFIITDSHPFQAFPLVSIASIASAVLFFYFMRGTVRGITTLPSEGKTFWLDLSTGIYAIICHKSLRLIALCAAITATTSQVVNLTLPAFIQLEIKGNSSLFGLCESLWALGGISASFALTIIFNKLELKTPSISLLFLLGLSLLGLGSLHHPSGIAVACLFIGFLFSATKTITDALIMITSSCDTIGRVRSNLSAITSSIGMVIYTIPLIFHQILPSTLYLLVGSITIFTCIFISYVLKPRPLPLPVKI